MFSISDWQLQHFPRYYTVPCFHGGEYCFIVATPTSNYQSQLKQCIYILFATILYLFAILLPNSDRICYQFLQFNFYVYTVIFISYTIPRSDNDNETSWQSCLRCYLQCWWISTEENIILYTCEEYTASRRTIDLYMFLSFLIPTTILRFRLLCD